MVPKIEMTVKSAKIALETIETVDFHVNDDLKVLFILADHLEVLKQGKVILLKAGDIFLVNPGEIIGMVGSSKNRVLMLNIQLLEFEQLVGQFKLTRPLSLSYHHDAYKNLTKLLSRLYIEQMQKKKGYQAIISGCVSLVLGTLLRTLTIEPLSFNRTIDNDNKIKNREVMAYINEHHTEKLTLQKLADHFYVSKFYLAHRFKEDLGMSVGKYLKEIRLLYAIRQLETSHLSVGEIAINNGFPNVRSFSDVFKERNGMTPTEFRKKKPILFTDTPGIEESDVYQLLENYITIEEISELKKHDFELFNKSIDLSRVIGKMAVKNFVVKLNPLNLTNTTALKLTQLGVRYIAVEKIILKVKHNAKKEICFKDVTDIIDNILQQGFLPYIQLQTVDWEAIKPSEKAVFLKVLKQLSYHLQSNYPDMTGWVLEFRCFYEEGNDSSLCRELVEAIPYFVEIIPIHLHFPRHPHNIADIENNSGIMIKSIDDFSQVRELPLEQAMVALEAPAIIDRIVEMENIKGQTAILKQMASFDQDEYLIKMTELTMANSTVWYVLNQLKSDGAYYIPLSLDATPLFNYFPTELAAKMALMDAYGFFKVNIHAYQFISELYREIVYQDEHCIVTKRRENYRILMVRPEKSSLNYIRQADFNQDVIEQESAYAKIELELDNITGTYKKSSRRLSPKIKQQQDELIVLDKTATPSLMDVMAYNNVHQPAIEIEKIIIEENYHLEVSLPLLGIYYIQLDKMLD